MRTPNDLLAAAHNWNVVHGIVSILVQNHVSRPALESGERPFLAARSTTSNPS